MTSPLQKRLHIHAFIMTFRPKTDKFGQTALQRLLSDENILKALALLERIKYKKEHILFTKTVTAGAAYTTENCIQIAERRIANYQTFIEEAQAEGESTAKHEERKAQWEGVLSTLQSYL
jgi:hypothetical protein